MPKPKREKSTEEIEIENKILEYNKWADDNDISTTTRCLSVLETLFWESSKPNIYPHAAWQAIYLCTEGAIPFPEWVNKYLKGSALRILKINKPGKKLPQLITEAIGFTGAAKVFSQNHDMNDAKEVLILFQEILKTPPATPQEKRNRSQIRYIYGMCADEMQKRKGHDWGTWAKVEKIIASYSGPVWEYLLNIPE